MNTGSKLVKIDIIIETVMMNELTNILVDEGAPGYTIVGPVASRGGSSRMDKNPNTRNTDNSYLFVICEEETSKKILESVGKVLKYYSGACFVTDVSGIEMYHRS
jgi:nitrogen regulatory protein PII